MDAPLNVLLVNRCSGPAQISTRMTIYGSTRIKHVTTINVYQIKRLRAHCDERLLCALQMYNAYKQQGVHGNKNVYLTIERFHHMIIMTYKLCFRHFGVQMVCSSNVKGTYRWSACRPTLKT